MFYEFAILLVFPAAMVIAAMTDLFTMTIPNRVSLGLIAAFFVMAPIAGLDLATIAEHVGVGLAMLAISFVLFARGYIGGGDAKLFAATALWVGYDSLLTYVIVSSVLGGMLTLALLFLRMMPLPAGVAKLGWVARLHDAARGVPYGIALAAAGLLVYPETLWMTAATL